MNLTQLAIRSLWSRRTGVLLTITGIAVSVALIVGVDRLRVETREQFVRTVSGADLIVGARTSPVNLLLYAVFRIGDPTNNVRYASFRKISAHPKVRFAIPLSLGDSHRGYRVLGTTAEYFEYLAYGSGEQLAFTSGRPFAAVSDAVIGAEVAAELGYRLGQRIVIAHGVQDDGLARHDDQPFEVVGILAATGTPIDATVHVSLAAIDAIHAGWAGGTPPRSGTAAANAVAPAAVEPETITAFFLGLHNRIDVFQLQRAINSFRDEPLTAILPGATLQSLWSLFSVAEDALVLVTAMTLLTGVIGMLVGILATLQERRREVAVLRAIGARPRDVFVLLLMESTLLTVAGVVAGYLLLTAVAGGAAVWIDATFGAAPSAGLPSQREIVLLSGIVLAGSVAGLLPAWRAYRYALHDGLSAPG